MSKERTKNQSKNKNKERTDKEFEDELNEAIQKSLPKVPKTNYCGLLGTKEGIDILKKMSWVDIEELTDYEFFG
jgi:ERCC4-type nuclease